MKQIDGEVITVCAFCPHVKIAHDTLICLHPKTTERIQNPKGLRIDEPREYLDKNGFPDWCPLEEKA